MSKKGFTLIELMIVVAIIAIIAAIAIPNLLRSRLAANESSAIGAMRTISSSEAAFQTAAIVTDANGIGQYGSLTQLSNPGAGQAPFVDAQLGGGGKSGYNFLATDVAVDTAAPQYTATAGPVVDGRTGVRGFFVDESGVITFTQDGTAPDSANNPIS